MHSFSDTPAGTRRVGGLASPRGYQLTHETSSTKKGGRRVGYAMLRLMTLGLVVAFGLLLAGEAAAGPLSGRVVVDGRFEDWSDAAPAYAFPGADPGTDPPVVTGLWIRSDRDRLILRVRLSAEVLLQGDSGLALHIDTDANPATGQSLDGLGAECSWFFSRREGRVRVLGAPIRVLQGDLGLRQAPTVSASEFEVSFDRKASVAGAPLFPGASVALALTVESGGRVVASTGGIDVTLDDAAPPSPQAIVLPTREPGHIRILSYNVLFDGCFERPLPFRRIVGALDPDVLSLQELYRHSPEETLEWIRRVLPGSEWHTAGFGQGVILSRFPVLAWGPLGTRRRGAWAILDTPQGRLALVNPHPPCCGDEAGRQEEFDAMAAWIRDSRASGLLGPEMAVVVAGDMNLVGDSRQLATLLEGAIVDTVTHGLPAPPDADGTPLADAAPYHLSGTEAYTWRSDRSEFAPGKLDYIVYSDSVLDLARAFVLWTPELPEDTLRETGLEAEDTVLASDHLPVVADVYFRDPSSR